MRFSCSLRLPREYWRSAESIRAGFRTLAEVNYPRLVVLSYNEIAPEIELFSVGVLTV